MTVSYAPGEALRMMHRRLGRVVVLPVPRRPIVYLFGPEANEFVFAHDELFRWREAFEALIPVDGETALILSDGADHTRRRALVRPGLHHRQVASYVRIMADSADAALDAAIGGPSQAAADGPRDRAPGTSLHSASTRGAPASASGTRDGGAFDAYAVFRAAIRRSTMRSLFGEHLAEHEERVGADLQPLFDLTERLQTIPLHERLRTPLWRNAMAARSRIDVFVAEQIARARAADLDSDADDSPMLSMLMHGRDGTGSGLSDKEIRDQVVSLIAAGYETTSAAMAWTVHGIGSDRELLGQVRDEVLSVCGEAPPSFADLSRLPLLSACVTEALRLWPPGVVSARSVAVPFDFGGRSIAAGSLVLFSPYVTHRDPAVYDDPTTFRPQRWLDGAKRPSSQYLPFGGGAHRCIGSTMATTELTVMLARLLARSSYELVPQRVRATSMASMRPKDGMPIVLT